MELDERMQNQIIERVSALVSRVNARKGLLSTKDLAEITGFTYHGRTLQQMIRSPGFPSPIMIGTREKRWYSGEVFDWIDKQRAI